MKTARVLAVGLAVMLSVPALRAGDSWTFLEDGNATRSMVSHSDRPHNARGTRTLTEVVSTTIPEAFGWGFERREEGWIQEIADPSLAAWRTRTVRRAIRDEVGIVNFDATADPLMLWAPRYYFGDGRTGASGHTARGSISSVRRPLPGLPDLVSSCGEIPRVLLSGDPALDAAQVAADGIELVGVTSSVRRVMGGWEYTWRVRNATARDLAFSWPFGGRSGFYGWSMLLQAETDEVLTSTSPYPPRVAYTPVSFDMPADDGPVFRTVAEVYRPAR